MTVVPMTGVVAIDNNTSARGVPGVGVIITIGSTSHLLIPGAKLFFIEEYYYGIKVADDPREIGRVVI